MSQMLTNMATRWEKVQGRTSDQQTRDTAQQRLDQNVQGIQSPLDQTSKVASLLSSALVHARSVSAIDQSQDSIAPLLPMQKKPRSESNTSPSSPLVIDGDHHLSDDEMDHDTCSDHSDVGLNLEDALAHGSPSIRTQIPPLSPPISPSNLSDRTSRNKPKSTAPLDHQYNINEDSAGASAS
jgi:hypothetical protein